jgi:hypothetical protein
MASSRGRCGTPPPRFPERRERGINEYSPHDTSRDREKVRSILPFHLANLDEPEIRLIDERGGLQRMAG